ncbi:MAG: hypothetical protein IJY66_04035, partial [Clostridia bacterium]|nr:hypothetical protein [Clostridia bacterium]
MESILSHPILYEKKGVLSTPKCGGEIWNVRTGLSNLNNIVVHFFDARQMKRCFGYAETQRKRVQGDS